MSLSFVPASEIDLSTYFHGAFRTAGEVLAFVRHQLENSVTDPFVTDMAPNIRQRFAKAAAKLDIELWLVENGATLPKANGRTMLCIEPLCVTREVTSERKNAKTGKVTKITRNFDKVEKLRVTLVPALEVPTETK